MLKTGGAPKIHKKEPRLQPPHYTNFAPFPPQSIFPRPPDLSIGYFSSQQPTANS